MRSKHSNQTLWVPDAASVWNFNEASGTCYDAKGNADLTMAGCVYNGDSITCDQSSSANYFNAPSGKYAARDKFSCFLIFKCNTTTVDSDILTVSSGIAGGTTDYTWYFDTDSASTGFILGVATASSYGAQVGASPGAIDTTKKYYALFGYERMPGTGVNRAFLYFLKDGDSAPTTATSLVMNDMITTSTHSVRPRAHATGTSCSVNYYHMRYWDNEYLENPDVLDRLIKLQNS